MDIILSTLQYLILPVAKVFMQFSVYLLSIIPTGILPKEVSHPIPVTFLLLDILVFIGFFITLFANAPASVIIAGDNSLIEKKKNFYTLFGFAVGLSSFIIHQILKTSL